MANLLFDKHETIGRPRYAIVPRQYQHDALDETFRLFGEGVPGVLIRQATGTGKTFGAIMIIDRWLQEHENNRALIISYERYLCHQFRQEVHDVLGILPGLEMAEEEVSPSNVPLITVASRATLQVHSPATEEQVEYLTDAGLSLDEIGLCTRSLGKRLISYHRQHGDLDTVRQELQTFGEDYRCNRGNGRVSRVHKFDPSLNWLVVYDEAHKHVMHLVSVGHLVDWFGQNPRSRRLGLTATPMRSDNTSLKDMFPGVAIDFPLYAKDRPCAVGEGYAVPFRQKFIRVESVDFEEIKKLCGDSQERRDLEMAKQLEGELATVCQPTLDLVEDRRTLIFSPSVQMARDVADWINARAKCRCSCGRVQWHVFQRVGDGAQCIECRTLLTPDHVLRTPELQCHALWGMISHASRMPIYEGHQRGEFQFLSVCGLCREGYNDQDLEACAIFAPVSQEARGRAEQMKGRIVRPLRGLLDGLDTKEERLSAIANSSKPYGLVIDLVGVTGLGDCASTVQIYAEGLEDEILLRVEQLVLGGVEDIEQAIEQARVEEAEDKERKRKEREWREEVAREQARRRAEAGVTVDYSVHEVGDDTGRKRGASEAQLRYLHFLGMDFDGWIPSGRQAGRMITQLKDEGLRPSEVAYTNSVKENKWSPVLASKKQKWALRFAGIQLPQDATPIEASKLIDRLKSGGVVPADELIDKIRTAGTGDQLDEFGRLALRGRAKYSEAEWRRICNEGRARRETLSDEF